MAAPDRRRAAVVRLQGQFGVSERRACAVVGQHRSTQRRRPAARTDADAGPTIRSSPPSRKAALRRLHPHPRPLLLTVRLLRNIEIEPHIRQYCSMKTTIDLPDALYRKAKIRAAERGTTLRALLAESLEVHLLEPAVPDPELPQRDRIRTDERGWPILQRAPDDTRVITDDFINQLREEEGV